jgi:hypothetical protein
MNATVTLTVGTEGGFYKIRSWKEVCNKVGKEISGNEQRGEQ